MGRIFHALDAHTGRPVALKLMRDDRAANAERFAREAQVLASIRHPGIVHYVAHGSAADGTPYLAMEWLDGVDLATYTRGVDSQAGGSGTLVDTETLAPPGMSLAALLPMAHLLAQAVTELHRRGVVHRDIKPSNVVLVDADVHRPKLVDFGTALVTSEPVRLTVPGQAVGTPLYMAPEQARGATDIGPQADVWGLGCVMYEALTGRPPFVAPRVTAVLARILFDEPVPLDKLRPDVPPELIELIVAAMRKDPLLRPRDGGELVARLTPLMALAESEARTAHASSRVCLTQVETRIRCVLLVATTSHDAALAQRMNTAIDGLGGRIDWLTTGACAITCSANANAADQANAIAHMALALRAVLDDTPMCIATGRAEKVGESTVGEFIDRAVSALGQVPAGGIELDETSCTLLEHRFVIDRRPGARPGTRSGAPMLRSRRQWQTGRTLLGQVTRSVGRKRELATLQATLDECVEESVARAVLVTAAAGVGKSHLCREFLAAVEDTETGVLVGQGDAVSAGSPFVMIGPAIRRACQVLDRQDAAEQRERIHARVRTAVTATEVTRVAAFLGEIASVQFPEAFHPGLAAARRQPQLMGDLMLDAWLAWLAGECRSGPVLIVLDDLHWGDLPSVTFVDAALRRLAEAPLFVFALARPEVRDRFPTLWGERAVQEIPLPGLTRRASTQLIRQVLGSHVSHQVADELYQRSGGNAFYLEELIRAVESGGVEHLPETILGMVQARLDGLNEQSRQVLRAASVFGEVFWTDGVVDLLGRSPGAFRTEDWLDDLAQAEVIEPVARPRISGQREFAFRHALIRDGAYASLTREDRMTAHACAAAWLERVGDTDAFRLAQHHVAGGAPDRAIGWFHRAATQALEGNDLDAAMARAQAAIDAGAKGQLLGELCALQSVAAYWQSDYTRARATAERALGELSPGSAPWFRALGGLVVTSARLGRDDRVRTLATRLHAVAAMPGAEADRIAGLCRCAFQLIFHGHFADADHLLEAIEQQSTRTPDLDRLTSAQIAHVTGLRAAHTGDVPTFMAHLQRALDGFEASGDRRNVALERTTLAWCHAELGELDTAVAICEDSLEQCRALDAQQAITYAKVNLGYILSLCDDGKVRRARQLLEQAIQECAAVSNSRLEGWALAHLSYVDLREARYRAQLQHARAAVDKLVVAPGLWAWALACEARARLALDQPQGALERAMQAIRVVREQGGILQGESLPPLVLSQALWALEDREAAVEAAVAASERLDARALRIHDPTRRQTFLALPDNRQTAAWTRSITSSSPTSSSPPRP